MTTVQGAPLLAIETHGLSKRFGRRTAVDALELRVPAGCVYGFLGPNGAGKTTTMRLLLGLLRGDAGSVRLLGRDLRRERLAALRQVGALVETPALYEHLSGRANLDLTRGLLGLPASEIDRVLELVDLRDAASRRVSAYSLGMKQRLALARALLGSPGLLLLDEPTNGLDPHGIVAMRALVRDLPSLTGATVFMSSHLLGEVEQTASVVGLMNAGRLVLQDEVGALTGARSLRFEVDDPARASAVLSARGVAASVDPGAVLVAVEARDLRTSAAELNRALVEAGLAVSGVSAETRSLEQVYREVTRTLEAAA